MLEVTNISFTNNFQVILDNISFKLESGNGLQLIGANGCGKTTLLKLLAQICPASAGTINWQTPARIAFLGHKNGLKANLTVIENFNLQQKLHGITKTIAEQDVILALGLKKLLHKKIAELSAGQQRKVALAIIFANKAANWLLDEPFTALDAAAITFTQQQIITKLQQGGVVIFSSHQSWNNLPNNIKTINLQPTARVA